MLQIKYTSKTNKLRKRDPDLWLSEALDKGVKRHKLSITKISARDIKVQHD